MLSRVADALYWMSRYVERAEHAARVLGVTRHLLIDLKDVDPEGAKAYWQGTLSALGLPPDASQTDVAFDEAQGGSIVTCMSRARENARQVREVTSSEMWQHLNEAYWTIHEAGKAASADDLSEILDDVIGASFLWGGVTDATMARGEGWLFIKLGQFVERADRSSRLISVRAQAAKARARGDGGPTGENVIWLTLLRSLSALEAYRKLYPTRIDPAQVIGFVVLDREFPRTVRYSIAVAHEFARRLSRNGSEAGARVERRFGKLAAQLEFSDVAEVLAQGVDQYLEGVLAGLGEASMSLQHNYFLH